MTKIEYNAKLLPDGHISCPKKVVDKLKLKSGIQVRIIIDSTSEEPEVELPDKTDKMASLYGIFPKLKTITEQDIKEAKGQWNKAVERIDREL